MMQNRLTFQTKEEAAGFCESQGNHHEKNLVE
jgi:hypothetical protein